MKEITDFAKEYGLEIRIKCRFMDTSLPLFYGGFENVDVSQPGILIGVYGNDPAYNDERLKQKKLSVSDIEKCVAILNGCFDVVKQVASHKNDPIFENMIQQLINDYANLRHYRVRTEGMQLIDGTVLKFGE